MNKIPPSIVIWNLVLRDKESKSGPINIYFLFYRMAKRFIKKYETELEQYNVDLYSEPLWFW